MRRRRLLALCGTLVAGAGCQQNSDEGETLTPVPSDAIGTRTSTEAASASSVDVTDATVKPGVVLPGDDSIRVGTTAGQYLVLSVKVTGPGLERTAFELDFDGERYRPETFRNGLYRDGEWGLRYTGAGGPLVFDLPETGDASDVRLSWPTGEWIPSDTVRERLEAPLPSFDVSLTGPAVVTADEQPTLDLTVTNEGSVAGWYVLALNRSGPQIAYAPVDRFDGVLEPGGTETITVEAESPYVPGSEPRPVTYRLDASGDRSDAVLRISPVEAKAETATEN